MTAPLNTHQQHRAAWLREAARHQRNAAIQAASAREAFDAGDLKLAAHWQHGASASAYNARCNLFAAMNIELDYAA